MTNNDNIKKNSILRQWNTPFETPPFDKIKFEDFYPAILYCIKQSNMVLDKIKHTKEPTFENIIEPFEQCDNLHGHITIQLHHHHHFITKNCQARQFF